MTVLKYNPSNPRTMAGAKKRNWTVVEISVNKVFIEHNISWLGLENWVIRNAKGDYLCEFLSGEFAFENPVDAMIFQFKWQ